MLDQAATALWGSSTFPRVLAILVEQPNREFTFSELVHGSGADRESVHRALRRAMAGGLISRRKSGNQFLYSADLKSPFFPEVQSLATKTYGVRRLLTEALRTAGEPLVELAFFFGSYAAGAARPDSDIDLMVIGTATRFDLASLLEPSQQKLERHVNALAYSRSEVGTRLGDGDAFFLEVWAGPKVMLIGTEDDLPKIGDSAASGT